MKKILTIFALCALVMGANAAKYNYLCGIKTMKVTTEEKTGMNQYTLTFQQICKNTNEYHKTTTYLSTVTLVVNAGDKTLEGTYSTEDAANAIDMDNTKLVYNGNTRVLRNDSVSSITITKIDKDYYAISDGILSLTAQGTNYGKNTYDYNYSYDVMEILAQDIKKSPYCFRTTEDTFEPGEYLCGITRIISVDTLKLDSKYKFTLRFVQVCKNLSEYDKSYTYYYGDTVKLDIYSVENALEGTYNSANGDFNLNTSEMYVGSKRYLLREDQSSTLTITKTGDKQYAVSTGCLYFTDAPLKDRNKYTYICRYSYDCYHILEKGIAPEPFNFGWSAEFVQEVYHYDMTVNGVSVMRDDTDYDSKRYFMILNCSGKNRASNAVRNYEVQLAIYPDEASIVGNFATQGGDHLMWASNSYVKDKNASKTRNLANDSVSSILIQSKSENKYSFYGGTLICVDKDANYSAVYGKQRVKAVHYYHFSDNGGAGIEFGYDESNTSVDLTASKVNAEKTVDDFTITVNAVNENNIAYILDIRIDSETLAGTHQYNGTLDLHTKVMRGSNDDYAASGSTVYIVSKGGNAYTLSATILTEKGFTYNLAAIDFTYNSGSATGMESRQPSAVSIQKVIRDGQMIIVRDGKEYNAFGVAL